MTTREFHFMLIGFNIAMWLCIAISWVARRRLNHRKCEHCKRKFWTRDSTCKDHPNLFCTDYCETSYGIDFLISEGIPPEVAIKIVCAQESK
jgi:hypothetical protein